MPNPSVVQHFNASSASTTATTFTGSFGVNCAAGNTIVVGIGNVDASVTVSSVTDNHSDGTGGVFQQAIETQDPTNNGTTQALYYALSIAGGATTITVNISGASSFGISIFVEEWANVTSVGPSASGTGAAAMNMTAGTLSPAQQPWAAVAIFSVGDTWNGAGSGYTALDSPDIHSNGWEYQVFTTTSSQTPNAADTTASSWAAVSMALYGPSTAALEEVPGSLGPAWQAPPTLILAAQEEFVQQPIRAIEEEIGWLPPPFYAAPSWQAFTDEELPQVAAPPPGPPEEYAPTVPLFAMPSWWASFVPDEVIANLPFEEEGYWQPPPPLVFAQPVGFFDVEFVPAPTTVSIEEWAPPAVIPVTVFASSGAFVEEEFMGVHVVGNTVVVDVIGVGHFIGLGHV